jgi:hypothetical protein
LGGKSSSSLDKVSGGIFKTGEAMAEIAKQCLASITSEVPPPFCWKKNPAGVDVECPANHFQEWSSGK